MEEKNIKPAPGLYPTGSYRESAGGPCRELAKTRIGYLVQRSEERLAGLKALLKVAEHAEPNSPLELLLADMAWKIDARPT